MTEAQDLQLHQQTFNSFVRAISLAIIVITLLLAGGALFLV